MEDDRLVTCPVCRSEFEIEDYLEAGDSAECPDCMALLKIVKLDPPELEMESGGEEEEDEEEDE